MDDPNREVIELNFPASTRFIRLSRLAAATLAAEHGFDVEAADDVRIAVDELATLLVDGGHAAPVQLRFTLSGDGLVVDGRCSGPDVAPIEPSDLVEAILAAVTDDHDVSAASGTRTFRFLKRRQTAAHDDGPAPGTADLG